MEPNGRSSSQLSRVSSSSSSNSPPYVTEDTLRNYCQKINLFQDHTQICLPLEHPSLSAEFNQVFNRLSVIINPNVPLRTLANNPLQSLVN
jgi:hypothetical protein